MLREVPKSCVGRHGVTSARALVRHAAVVLAFALAGCVMGSADGVVGVDNPPLDGSEGGACYGNVTCGHGTCGSGTCDCDVGWAGAACNTCAVDYEPQGQSCVLVVVVVPTGVLLEEDFEDVNLADRGWVDEVDYLVSSTTEHLEGSTASLEYRFLQGADTPTSGGSIRKAFAGSESVYVSYWVKYSANWEGSNEAWHPHELYVMTSEDDLMLGPSSSHLTAYIEQNEGVPLVALQDSLNIDDTQLGVDLRSVTEDRAACGCNGGSDSEGYSLLDCWDHGDEWRNGKEWRADGLYFQDSSGSYYKNDWHHIEAQFTLNTISGGIGQSDGIVRYWYDGELLIEHTNVLMRTGLHPTMMFDKILMAPYIGSGSPVEQVMWLDDLTVATAR